MPSTCRPSHVLGRAALTVARPTGRSRVSWPGASAATGSRAGMRNSSRTWLFRENKKFATGLPAGSIVLDAGAGDQPYKSLLSHCIYEACDFEKVDKPYAKSTYVCDLSAIPVEDCRFDAV